MTTDYPTANNEICGLFWADWNSSKTSSIVGYVPDVVWPYKEPESEPDKSKFWCRLSIQTISEKQASLTNSDSKKRFTSKGFVAVQLFYPKSKSKAGELGTLLANVAKNIFRGKSTASNVWFRNVRIKELENETLWHRANVIAEFEYDETI